MNLFWERSIDSAKSPLKTVSQDPTGGVTNYNFLKLNIHLYLHTVQTYTFNKTHYIHFGAFAVILII